MQNTTKNYKLEINKPSREFECKITIGDNIYTNEDLVNLTLEYTQPQEGFSIGDTISQSLDLTLLNRGDIIYSTSQIKVEIGLKIGSTIEYILMGIFNIDDIEKIDYTTKFTAYDNMIKFETPYFSSLGDKPTLKQVVNELSKITGIEFIGSLPNYTVSKLEGFTCREVLSYVASICGGNAVITRDGKFTIKSLSEIKKSIDGNNYFDYKREEVKYKIGKISCQIDENNILYKGSTGTDSMELGFENPWVTETILNDLYNKLNGLSYLGYSMKWQGDLSLDPYDIVTVTDIKNVIRKIPILSQKISYTGGLTSEIGAKGESKNKNSFSSSGSTSNKVNRVVMEQAVIKEALINKANIRDLEASNAKIENLQVKAASIESAIIGVAYISDLTAINANIQNLIAADAKINTALINKADITELNAVQGNITSLNSQIANIQTLVNGNLSSENIQAEGITSDKLTIANGFITNAMIANLDVSKINAGDISTNKFRIVSDNGGIEIVGATQQFKDKNNKVIIQMGQDAKGNFNFILRGEDGTTTLIDNTGIKEKAIADNLIKGNMVATDAIGEKQINYSSLITGLNKDTNTQLIKASKVAIDLAGQTLDLAFNSLKNQADNNKNIIENHSTNISAMQGQISTAINNTQIVKDGKTILLKDDYNRTISKVDSINSTIGTHTTKINELTGNITSVDTKVNSVQRDLEGTKSTVSSHTNLIDGLNSKLSTQGSSIEQLKNQITLKVNSTELNAAINKKANSTDVYTKTEVYTRAQTDSAIKIAKDEINLGVKNTYETKSNVENKISTAVNNVQVGGRNYCTTTALANLKSADNENPMKFNNANEHCPNGFYAVGNKNSLGIIRLSNVINSDGYWTVSFDIRGSQNLSVGMNVDICGLGATTVKTTGSNSWKRVNVTVNVTNYSKDEYNYVDFSRLAWAYFFIRNIKVEQGNKATDWTPAPEDVDLVIDKKANKTDVYTKSETYTKAQTDSAIKVAKDEINLGVSQTYETKTNVETKVNNAINNVQVGGRNIFRYSGNFGTSVGSYWTSNGGGLTFDSSIKYNGYNTIKTTVGTGIVGIWYKLEPNVEYTYSALVRCNTEFSGNGGFPLHYWAGKDNVHQSKISVIKYDTLYRTPNEWKLMYITFKLTDDADSFRPFIYWGTTTSFQFNIAYMKLEKGNKPSDWSPAPEDIDLAIDKKANTVDVYKKTEVYTKTETNSQINVAKDQINLSVSGTYETKTNVESKINTAKSNAINSAKSYTDGQITTVNKTITNKVAEIKATTDSISQKVSTTESKITTINNNISGLTNRVYTAESKLTSTSLTTTISSAINEGTSSINTTQFVMDKSGLIIKNGALTIKNKAGTTVFSGDTSGNLKLAGSITSGATITGGTLKSSNNDMYFDLNGGYMLLYNDGTKIGQTNKNRITGTSIYGVSNGAEYGKYSTLSAKTSPSDTTYSMMMTVSGSDLTSYISKGVNLGANLHTNNWNFRMGKSSELCWRQSGSSYDSFITEGAEGMLRLYGDNGMYLGYREGATNSYIIAIRESGSHDYPRALNMFNSERDIPSNGEYAVEITAPLKMRGQTINECSNIKTLGLEIVEPLAFHSDDSEETTATYTVTKNNQNIVEFIGSTEIVSGEVTVPLPDNMVFRNYVVLLTPIGLNRNVSLVEKSDDSFKLMGDDGTVDYVIKFESVDYSKYMAKSISIDAVDNIQRSEDDLPKVIELSEDSSPFIDVPTPLESV